jgi:hypothetical protein
MWRFSQHKTNMYLCNTKRGDKCVWWVQDSSIAFALGRVPPIRLVSVVQALMKLCTGTYLTPSLMLNKFHMHQWAIANLRVWILALKRVAFLGLWLVSLQPFWEGSENIFFMWHVKVRWITTICDVLLAKICRFLRELQMIAIHIVKGSTIKTLLSSLVFSFFNCELQLQRWALNFWVLCSKNQKLIVHLN